ncbi:MAG: ATP-binding protein [Pseudomonadota bacterium]
MMDKQRHATRIRKRMTLLNILVFIFIGFLVVAYTIQFFSMEKNLFILEDFHDLFDNVLEVRRYEKNYLLGVGSENIDTILEYLDTIDKDIIRQEDNIIRVVGWGKFLEFRDTLKGYREIFARPHSVGSLNETDTAKPVIDAVSVRSKGKEMIAFTRKLLDDKQQSIRTSLKLTIIGFIVLTGDFFFFIIIGLYFQAKSVLDRIAFVQQATRNVLNGNFEPIICKNVNQDEITDLIQAFNKMASELENRQEQLIQSRKLASIGTFSSGIAHELNNPLNNISLSADTLLEEYSSLSEKEMKEIITDIISQTDRATEVVKNLLDFSRDQAPSTRPLHIKQVVAATKKLIANELRLKSIWLEDYIPDDLPLVMGDLHKLQQVFLNLFVNSVYAMPDGGLIYIDAKQEPDEYVRISVSDTGGGIEPEKVEHIFDPFYTTKEVGKGTGLGLSIVYGIIKKHGGYIEVKSKMNVGTMFSIYLPIAPI